jgi:hypothetical protein
MSPAVSNDHLEAATPPLGLAYSSASGVHSQVCQFGIEASIPWSIWEFFSTDITTGPTDRFDLVSAEVASKPGTGPPVSLCSWQLCRLEK